MQATTAERDKLRTQLNLLKSHAGLTIDRRSLGATVAPCGDAQPVAMLALKAQLTDSQRAVLEAAISPAFLRDQGWREGGHGEVLTERGRTVFQVGFIRAVRKVLGDLP